MIFVIFLVIVLALMIYFISRNNKKLRQLRREYEAALKGNDKKLALKKGQDYYSALRRYKQLTGLDELEIAKDIESMK